ncbi:MAG: thiamine pyrophosphate-dependent enzyme, partial [Firmicutes bacterium]|nr:thiamine pyrophosphate-dependent enzyme [Bacillota bacterium]
YIINAYKIATDVGLGKRINTIMQSAFFYLAKIIDYKSAVEFMRLAAKKSYSAKGEKVLAMNYSAIDSVVKNLHMIDHNMLGSLSNTQPNIGSKCKYYDEFSHVINSRKGDTLPVSAFSPDGFVPTGTSQYEKRNLATMLPEWVPENCIQCNFCALVCPHATIRPHLLDGKEKMPKNFKTIKANGFADKQYRIQLNPHDCTGCGQCANICPAKNKALVMKDFVAVDESENYYASLKLPYPKSDDLPMSVKNSQFLKPYFEFSGACAGCGQTPYIKLVSQLFGDRMVIANATGCTSIYGGSSPTCPYTVDKKGHGPAWANSLFEDNAEFGYGVKLAKEIRGKDTSVWIIGGDGWAYDIGFGGVDHIAAQNLDVNILVLDTEVYSNTGGQSSKSTPAGSVAKFAAAGKSTNKKDLGAMLMNYDNVYVAQIAIGADYNQTLNAIREAEAHKGPSVIIAYSTCINHGIDMSNGMRVMRNAVECGYWVNYRRRPATDGKPAEFILDSKAPTGSYSDFIANETRYKSLMKCNPEAAAKLCEQAETAAKQRYEKYKKLTNAPLT